MSRVDEALRRARGVETIAPQDVDNAGHAAERPDQSALELYPHEHRPVVDRNAIDRNAVDRKAMDRPARNEVTAPAEQLFDRGVPARFGDAYAGKLVSAGKAPSSSIEQYRRLAATVHHLQGEQGLCRLMVTSSVPQEGKTLTVANLAMTLSESYKRRVLLIDADLRRPSIHDVFGIENKNGLCEALRSEPGSVQFVAVSPHLWVLPAGAPEGDPMAILASERMAGLLDEFATSFDWILLDAPPVGLMADAGLLVRLTRAVILVIGAGSTPHAVVAKTVAEVGREHIVGTVLNRIEEETAQWSGYDSGYGTPTGRSRPSS